MNSNLLNIRSILDLEQWQKIQDELAIVTGMAILIVDYKGAPVTKHSGCTEFCATVRKNPETAKYCQKCDSRGGIEAARLNKPFMYLCHCNIVDVAIPIVIDDKYIGAVMAGQVMAEQASMADNLEKILMSAYENSFIDQSESLRKKFERIPKISMQRINAGINLLLHLCNYIVGEAISKSAMNETYGKILGNVSESASAGADFTDTSLDAMINIKDQVAKAIMSKQVKSGEPQAISSSKHPILKPVIEYIYNNKHENIMLSQMAKLSHTSPSYLSRLFKKEMGKNFSDYVTDFKMTIAKNMLENTSLSVTDISNDLGFSDSGYFIKLFKKHEGITPAMFRKYMK
ncbi:MAG: PocR ligand-binding domain-containing protein [Christensenella sp.]|uniref:PocR ligand-binding domain-containing protein n=1 Tax=Christensenella sp. TaxID=1935934 RepID=UPI002B205062|nr:PocR ligand-binding domain-containing protein [Christensenella sp.]MEA5003534.1 PocR ligand-binding domain-containing protein [Christensenella sp.]